MKKEKRGGERGRGKGGAQRGKREDVVELEGDKREEERRGRKKKEGRQRGKREKMLHD